MTNEQKTEKKEGKKDLHIQLSKETYTRLALLKIETDIPMKRIIENLINIEWLRMYPKG